MTHPREPVPHTCPDIDKVIKNINEALKECNVRRRVESTTDELAERLSNIEWVLGGLEDDLEKLRTANSLLREWGIDEAQTVDARDKEISTLTKEVAA